MTPLEVINKVEAHLVAQGMPARTDPADEMSTCKYRTKENLACGVGCLIDDETALLWDTATNQSSSISDILDEEYAHPIPEQYHWMYSRAMPLLLEEIQQMHDNHDIPLNFFVPHIQFTCAQLRAKYA